MAKNTTNNNIKIHFRAEGEQELKNAIRALARATKDLKSSQVSLAKATGATTKAQNDAIRTGVLAHRNQRNMNAAVKEGSMTFSVFRSKLLLASFAVGLYAGTVGRLVQVYAEQEASEKRLQAALKSTGNASGLTASQITKMTKDIEEFGIVGDEINNKVASLLLTFTNIQGQGFERTLKAVNNMAIGFAQGVPTFEQLRSAAIQLGKALQDPAGQLGALSRSGFTFNDGQRETIKNLVKQNKLFEAQAIILDAAETQFGGLQEEMANAAEGAFPRLRNAMGSFGEALGEELTPGAIDFARSLTQMFKNLTENIDSMVVFALTIRDTAVAIGTYKVGMLVAIRLQKLFNAGLTITVIRQAAVTMGLSIFAATAAMAHMRQRMQNQELEVGEDLYAGYGQKVKEATVDLTKANEAMEKNTQNLKLQQEMAIANLNLENAELLGLTKIEIERFEQQKRSLMITQELLKIDEDKRKGMRGEVVQFVDLKIKYDKYLESVRSHIKGIKELEKANEAYKDTEEMIKGFTDESIVNTEKLSILNSDLSKKEKQAALQRVDNFAKFHKQLSAVFPDAFKLQELLDSGVGLKGMSDAMFNGNTQFERFAARLAEAITSGEDLNVVMKEFNETLKQTKEIDPMQQFIESSQMAISAFSGFTSSYGTLVDERMNRELEALRATSDFENASQEEREIMQNRVEQRFRSQRRKAFRLNKANSIANATMNTFEGVTKALSMTNMPLAALIAALGMAQVQMIASQPAPRFATGGSFITSGPQSMLVGESGPEKVTIQPLSGQNSTTGGGSTQNININVSAPLVDETILDVIIPKIEEAGRLNLA